MIMKKLFILALILIMGLSACGQRVEGNPTVTTSQPESATLPEIAETQSEPTSGTGGQPPDASAVMEETSGSLTARIFSTPETTIKQQDYSLQGWVNRAAVVSVNDTIVTVNAEDIFSVGLQLEPGPNLVEVIISDQDGNEVQFEITVFVEQ